MPSETERDYWMRREPQAVFCRITYPYPDDSRCWPHRFGWHAWRLLPCSKWPTIAECRRCGLTLVGGEEGRLPWPLRLVALWRYGRCGVLPSKHGRWVGKASVGWEWNLRSGGVGVSWQCYVHGWLVEVSLFGLHLWAEGG